AFSVPTSSPGAPIIRPKNFSGEGTLSDCGTYETKGETKCGSVVAAAIASVEPRSATSGLCAIAVATSAIDSIHKYATRNMGPPRLGLGRSLTRSAETTPSRMFRANMTAGRCCALPPVMKSSYESPTFPRSLGRRLRGNFFSNTSICRKRFFSKVAAHAPSRSLGQQDRLGLQRTQLRIGTAGESQLLFGRERRAHRICEAARSLRRYANRGQHQRVLLLDSLSQFTDEA